MMTPAARAMLEIAADRLADAADYLADCVEAARDEGATWEDVGDFFGISRQAAWQRWGPGA